MVMIFEKICAICHTSFSTHQPACKFCLACRGKKQDAYDTHKYRWQSNNKCADCGKSITDRAKRCPSCNAKYLNNCHFGENNPRWIGGKVYASDGYIRVLNRTHPRAEKSGYVYQHIVVWEEANKMSLPEGYAVHHLNGIRHDNRPQNLIALPRKKHHGNLIHQALKKRIRNLEAQIAQQRF
ncbi:MAG: HNH endonuclease [Dehalococcoidia bacterium]|nr:HNH endonuclease [Dehalococcoidia bacterium]